MKRVIRIGTRESRLAVWQAEHIKEQIEQANPDISAEIIAMKTTGDRILNARLDQAGGKGLFVKELDLALLAGRTDISVHSLKDMPVNTPDELPILAYSKREDPRDVLVVREGIPESGVRVIGSSSRRRTLQLSGMYPACTFTEIRGNVQTRIRRLESGHCDAAVLAAAGLKRLSLGMYIRRIFEPWEVIPAAGQGILAVQGRAGEEYGYLSCIMDEDSRTAALAERAFVRELNGGCSSPVAAYAKIEGSAVCLTGLYYNEETGGSMTGSRCGRRADAEMLGKSLALELKEKFADYD